MVIFTCDIEYDVKFSESEMKRYRIGRKLLQGFGALGAGFLTYKAVTSEEGLDIYNVGIARFGRAAVAVSLI